LPTETILSSSEIIVNSPNLTRQHRFALYLEGLARALYECGGMDEARQECEKISPLTVGGLRHGGMYLSLGSIPVVLAGRHIMNSISQGTRQRIKAPKQSIQAQMFD